MAATSSLDWLYHTLGWTLGGAGLLLLLWALFWDRSRGRRRCPKCWYDMAGVPGLKCPECGRTAHLEAKLHKTRRRKRWAIAGLLIVLSPITVWLQAQIRSGAIWKRLPTTALIYAVGRVDSCKPLWVLEARVERGDGIVGWVDRSSLWGWQWRMLERRIETARRSIPHSGYRWWCVQGAVHLLDTSERQAVSVPTARPFVSPDQAVLSLLSEGDAALRRFLGQELLEEGSEREWSSIEAHLLDGPLAEGVDAVVNAERGNDNILFFLDQRSSNWYLVGTLALTDKYGCAHPTLVERAGVVLVESSETVGSGSGILARDQVWHSFPDAREVVRFRVNGHVSGWPVYANWSYRGVFTESGTESRSFHVVMTVDYESNCHIAELEPNDAALAEIGWLFNRRWVDHFAWDETARAFTWRSSTPLDGWNPGNGSARLELDCGDLSLESLASCNLDMMKSRAANNPDIRRWARAIANHKPGTSVARQIATALDDGSGR